MDKEKSTIIWILFIGMAIILILLKFDKYGRLHKEFNLAQSRNVVAILSASSAANYSQRKFNATLGIPVKNCEDVARIGGNILPPGYKVVSQVIAPGATVNCVLDGSKINGVLFSVVGVN